jgi:hypothetical protein
LVSPARRRHFRERFHRGPKAEQPRGDFFPEPWRRVLAAPDKSPLEKFQKQPELL